MDDLNLLEYLITLDITDRVDKTVIISLLPNIRDSEIRDILFSMVYVEVNLWYLKLVELISTIRSQN